MRSFHLQSYSRIDEARPVGRCRNREGGEYVYVRRVSPPRAQARARFIAVLGSQSSFHGSVKANIPAASALREDRRREHRAGADTLDLASNRMCADSSGLLTVLQTLQL